MLEATLTDASDLEVSDDEYSSEDDFSERKIEGFRVIPTDTVEGSSLADFGKSSEEVPETSKVSMKPDKSRANSRPPIETNYARVEFPGMDSGYPQAHETPETNTEPETSIQLETSPKPEASQPGQPTATVEPHGIQKPRGMSPGTQIDCVILFCMLVWVVVYYFPSSSFFSGSTFCRNSGTM